MNFYVNADKSIHWLVQVIAKANRTYVVAKKDDSHTNLYFDPLSNRVLGRWINRGKSDVLLALNLTKQSFEWLTRKLSPIATVAYAGKKMDEVENELAESLIILGLNPEGFCGNMHYRIPEYGFDDEIIELINAEAISQWTDVRKTANEACQLVHGHLQIQSEIRIWPHHFDTGIYVEPTPKLGIGFGFAMEDDMVHEPYFYLSGKGLANDIHYLNLPELEPAFWEVNADWKGAILPVSAIENFPDKTSQKTLYDFIRNSLDWYLAL